MRIRLGDRLSCLTRKPFFVEINGWKLNLRMVYGWSWQRRARFNLREWLGETPDGNYAVLLYGIGEIGLNQQIAKIAVFQNKETPQLILRPRWIKVWFEGLVDVPVRFDADSQRAHVFEYIHWMWSKEPTGRERIIDLNRANILPSKK